MNALANEIILAALTEHRSSPSNIQILSPLGERKGRRLAYRVDNQDGSTIKVRVFENEAIARSVCELREGMEDAFAPVLARYGSVVIEEWIDGDPLTNHNEMSVLEPAGAILGRLHAHRPPGLPDSASTE